MGKSTRARGLAQEALAREQQDYEQAKGRYHESLTIYQRLGNATYTAW